ncbi:MAG: glutathione S-transferase family protein [Rhodospirillales bacterium]|nr:glutathione S-transferase family protein [Rhodospirillales bacterium]
MHHDLELVSHHLCPYVQRAVIALTEKGVAHERSYIDLANKPAWFTEISPLGKVPLLRVRIGMGDESMLFESAVICEYLEDTQPNPLHPSEPLARAHHRAWIEFASATLDDVAGFYNAKNAEAFETKRLRLANKFSWLERHLGDGPFFAGPRFALVDAAFGPLFRYFDTFDRIGDFGFFDDAPRVHAYRKELSKRPSVRQAVREDYSVRLTEFLRRRNSHVSTLVIANAA